MNNKDFCKFPFSVPAPIFLEFQLTNSKYLRKWLPGYLQATQKMSLTNHKISGIFKKSQPIRAGIPPSSNWYEYVHMYSYINSQPTHMVGCDCLSHCHSCYSYSTLEHVMMQCLTIEVHCTFCKQVKVFRKQLQLPACRAKTLKSS